MATGKHLVQALPSSAELVNVILVIVRFSINKTESLGPHALAKSIRKGTMVKISALFKTEIMTINTVNDKILAKHSRVYYLWVNQQRNEIGKFY